MLVTFPNRKMWSEHELSQHRVCQNWKCHLCATSFTADATLIEHLQLKHDLSQHDCKLLAVSSRIRSTEPTPATDEQCPLCLQKGWPNRRRFDTHVGRHLEDIALSVLPREVDSDSDQQNDSDDSSEVSSWIKPRTMNMNWADIHEDHLPTKSPMSCWTWWED